MFGLPLGDPPLRMIFDAKELNCPNKKKTRKFNFTHDFKVQFCTQKKCLHTAHTLQDVIFHLAAEPSPAPWLTEEFHMDACEKFPMTAKDHIENHLIAYIPQKLPSIFE